MVPVVPGEKDEVDDGTPEDQLMKKGFYLANASVSFYFKFMFIFTDILI